MYWEQAKRLLTASKALQHVIADCKRDKSIPWKSIINLIEVYRMTQQLEKTWAGKALSSAELKEYAELQQELQTHGTEAEHQIRKDEWHAIVKEVNANFDKNPDSEMGIALGKRMMTWVNQVFGGRHQLKNAVWEKGFKQGQAGKENDLSPQAVAWLDKAIDAYYKKRAFAILDKINTQPSQDLEKEWNNFLSEICGDSEEAKKEAVNVVLHDKQISQAAKDWLRKLKH
jgi:hypothetical protein